MSLQLLINVVLQFLFSSVPTLAPEPDAPEPDASEPGFTIIEAYNVSLEHCLVLVPWCLTISDKRPGRINIAIPNDCPFDL